MIGEDVVMFQLSRNRVWQLVKKYAVDAGLSKHVHPHTLRHSYATQVYSVTGDLRLVQELLGHQNLATTTIYTHLDDASKRRSIEGVF